ncbi:MAG: PPC domain-containing protein [Planctomycetaceae bacterium]|nr:PPC domain-containing protein [Planctomycetaceae bacterium]MCB9950917.1 PPC domain-containing protein [Planctomycetaceae bacterium]
MRTVLCLAAAIAGLGCLSSSALADLPSIRFDQIQPLGASVGTDIEVEIKGADIEGVDRLLFDHAGLTAEPVPEKERWFKIHVADDVPVGTYDVYLVGRFGVSNPRLFAVTKGLTDVADNDANRTRETAQPVEINSAVNGICNGNAEDYYRIVLKAGERVTIDCQAQRLDSNFDPVLSLTTPDGKLLAGNSDYYGQDPFIDFVAPQDGEFLISLNDLSYRGGQPYRLTISRQPQIENIFPAAVQAGQLSQFTALGRNLSGIGGNATEWSEAGQPLESVSFQWQPNDTTLANGDYTFVDHPTHHSVLPTAATCTLTGQQISVPGVEGLWSNPPVLVSEAPVLTEVEPNNTQEQTQKVSLPLVVGGRFNVSQDADWFEFTPAEKGPYTFNVYCERIAGAADPYLVIVDDQGRRINELDDFGHRINAFDGHLRDPSQEVNLEQDKAYRVLVQDRYGRGGARYHYVLEIRKAEPDFYAAVIHRSNQNPAGTTVFKGTATYLDVIIHHKGNTRSDITINGEELPPGLHVAPTVITNNTRGTLVLWADADAPDYTGPIKLVATGEFEGQSVRRNVRPYSRVWNNAGTSRPHRSQMIAIREQGPFDLRIEPTELEVQAGETAELKLELSRLWPDATNKVSIQPHAFPGGFQLGNFDIAENATTAELKISVQQNMRPGKYTLTVLGQMQVPFNKDPMATDKPQTLVATPSRTVTLTVIAKPQ